MTVSVSFFEAEDQQEQDRDEEQRRKYYGIYSAEVINLLDPFMMGRVQVRMKSFDPLDLQPWARVVSPMAGTLHGAYFIPSIGDEVVIAFEHGDLHAPYIIGSVHNFTHPSPIPSALAQIRALRTPLGNQLVFSEAGPAVALQSGPTPPAVVPAPPTPTATYSSFVLTPAGALTATPGVITLMAGGSIVLQCGDSSIAVTPAGVLINGKLVGVTAAGSASVVAPSVRINS